MTNQPTDNEWKYKAFAEFMSEKNVQDFDKVIDPKTQTEFMLRYFIEAIDNNIPKPTEVVAPVDIEDIIEKIGYLKRYSDTRYFDWEEAKKELRKILSKLTTPVEPINQERTDSEVLQGE